jgi:hypothetical protein
VTPPGQRRAALAITRVAATLLPASARSRYREQWQADVCGATELGLSPVRLALGAAVAAIRIAGTSGKGAVVLAAGNFALTLKPLGRPWVRTRLAVLQLGLATLYAAVLLLYVTGRIRLGLGHHEFTHGMHDPKDLVPFGNHMVNPLSWLYLLPQLYVMLHGWVLGGVLAAGSLVHALGADGRGRWLAAGAAMASLAVLAVALTGFGSDLRTWILD